jgi:hypothetical protein
VSKVWWDGEKLMAKPIPLVDFYQPVQDELAYREAVSLATWLFKKHFAREEHYASGRVVWEPCDTTAGVISQIDNMVCGLVQPAATVKESLTVQPAAPVQEPVAWINAEKRTFEWNGPVLWNTPTVAVLNKIPLYTTPPAAQRQWVGLTDEDIIKCTPTWGGTVEDVARAIEAKLKEKNNG